jgi:hypothetical protein
MPTKCRFRVCGHGLNAGLIATGGAMDNEPNDPTQDDLTKENKKAPDLGGRRKKADRRGRTSEGVFPERRWLRHRRGGGDRRSFPFFNPRQNRERREAFKEEDPEESC